MSYIPAYRKRIWLAEAPPGTWTSGPAVVYDIDSEKNIEEYRSIDYKVTGPYVLINEVSFRETMTTVLSAFEHTDIAPEHLAAQIERQVKAWLSGSWPT